jgi:hypothetical protein
MSQKIWKFKMPNSMLTIEVRHNVNVYENWVEVDQDGRGENTFQFAGEFLTFEEAIESAFEQVAQSVGL